MSIELDSYQSKKKLDLTEAITDKDQEEIIEAQTAKEEFIILKQQNIQLPQSQQNKQSLQEAQLRLKKIKDQILNKKSQISKKRQQLKEISDQIQEELQKIILKPPQTNNKNISSYFSKEQELKTQKQKQYKAQIKKVRLQIQKVKKQLTKIQQPKMNGVGQDKFTDSKNKLQSKIQELKSLISSKQVIQHEIETLNKGIEDLRLNEADQIMNRHITLYQQLNKEVKSERMKLNNLQRQDRYCMQKIKFLIEIIQLTEKKKQPAIIKQIDQNAIETQSNALVQQIKLILQQKYKVQGEIKVQFENLKEAKQKIEKQNWQIINKLRQYDSFLLNYYNTIKLTKKKKEVNQQVNSVNQSIKLQSQFKIQTVQTPQIKYQKYQKKSNIEFQIQNYQNSLLLIDNFDNKKSLIQQITIYYHQKNLLGLFLIYKTQFGIEQGLRMVSVPKIKEAKTLSFKISNNDLIQEVQIGTNPNIQNKIGYLKFKSKQSKIFEWGTIEDLKLTKLSFPQYISISIYVCLSLYESSNNPNDYLVHGIGFNLIRMQQRAVQKRGKNITSHRIKKIPN